MTVTEPIDRLLSAAEAERLLGIPAGTVRSWASRRRHLLWSYGLDSHHRPLFYESDLTALRDRTRTREEWAAIHRRRQRAQRDVADRETRRAQRGLR